MVALRKAQGEAQDRIKGEVQAHSDTLEDLAKLNHLREEMIKQREQLLERAGTTGRKLNFVDDASFLRSPPVPEYQAAAVKAAKEAEAPFQKKVQGLGLDTRVTGAFEGPVKQDNGTMVYHYSKHLAVGQDNALNPFYEWKENELGKQMAIRPETKPVLYASNESPHEGSEPDKNLSEMEIEKDAQNLMWENRGEWEAILSELASQGKLSADQRGLLIALQTDDKAGFDSWFRMAKTRGDLKFGITVVRDVVGEVTLAAPVQKILGGKDLDGNQVGEGERIGELAFLVFGGIIIDKVFDVAKGTWKWVKRTDKSTTTQGASTVANTTAQAAQTGVKGIVAGEGALSIFTYIPTTGRKFNQLTSRGWTRQSIHDLVNNPYTTRQAVNKANNNPATAYFRNDGHYVVRDDVTGQLIQMSDTHKTIGKGSGQWSPDDVIVNPFIP